MIDFKTDRVRQEWYATKLDGNLRYVVQSASNMASDIGWAPFLLTCIYRTPEENDACYGGLGDHLDGVHVEWRGVDVRTEGVNPDAIHAVVDSINALWCYDPARPTKVVAYLEGTGIGSNAPHLHCQTHPNTIKRID